MRMPTVAVPVTQCCVLLLGLLAACSAGQSRPAISGWMTDVEYSASAGAYVFLANVAHETNPVVYTSFAPQRSETWQMPHLPTGQHARPPYGLIFNEASNKFFIFDSHANTWSSTDGMAWYWAQSKTAINPLSLATNGSVVGAAALRGPAFTADGITWFEASVDQPPNQTGGGVGYVADRWIYWSKVWEPIATFYYSTNGYAWTAQKRNFSQQCQPSCTPNVTVLSGRAHDTIAMFVVTAEYWWPTFDVVSFSISPDAGTSWNNLYSWSNGLVNEHVSLVEDFFVRVDVTPSWFPSNVTIAPVDARWSPAAWQPYEPPCRDIARIEQSGNYAFAFGLRGYIGISTNFVSGQWTTVADEAERSYIQ